MVNMIKNISVENRAEPIRVDASEGEDVSVLESRVTKTYSKSPKEFELLYQANTSIGSRLSTSELKDICREVKLIHRHNIGVQYENEMLKLTARYGTQITFPYPKRDGVSCIKIGSLQLSDNVFVLNMLNYDTPARVASSLAGIDLASPDEMETANNFIEDLQREAASMPLHIGFLLWEIQKLFSEQFPSSATASYFHKEKLASAVKVCEWNLNAAKKNHASLVERIEQSHSVTPSKYVDSYGLFIDDLKESFISDESFEQLCKMITEAVENKLHPRHNKVFALMQKYVQIGCDSYPTDNQRPSDDAPAWHHAAFKVWGYGDRRGNSFIEDDMVAYLRAHKSSEGFAHITLEEIFEHILSKKAKQIEDLQSKLAMKRMELELLSAP